MPPSPPPFTADIRRWAILADFEAHLAAHNPAICSWVKYLTTHHTFIPTVEQWRGRASMDAMLRFYRDTNGWSAGPQLYVAPDGIWQMTPINEVGIHAGRGNSASLGVEVVGDHDDEFWQEPIRSMAYGVHVALLRWLSLPATKVKGHREWGSPKSCPGWAVDMDHLRRDLGAMLAAATPTRPTPTQITEASGIFGAPTVTADQCMRFINERGSVYPPSDIRVIIGYVYAIALPVTVNPAIVVA